MNAASNTWRVFHLVVELQQSLETRVRSFSIGLIYKTIIVCSFISATTMDPHATLAECHLPALVLAHPSSNFDIPLQATTTLGLLFQLTESFLM